PEAIAEILEKSQLKKEDIRFFLLHQANERIVAAVAKRLSVEAERFPMNLSEYGNTSAASIPILLDELNRSGRLRRGNHLILAGFGAGLSWGASLIKW
ncbi:MAG: 3-oxoacyl-[acyl-carrier-protein] synthase III C-terminal domain-containing protein, partial [Acetivibrio ethanolgignens]